MRPSAAERFWAKVDTSAGPEACWPWLGACYRNGYGAFGYGGGKVSVAHRWAYLDKVGPIPNGLVVDHLCRNVSCVNPRHLEAVTQRENVARAVGIGRPRSESCRSGHPFTSESTEFRKGGGRRCAICRRNRENAYNARRRAEGRAA